MNINQEGIELLARNLYNKYVIRFTRWDHLWELVAMEKPFVKFERNEK